MSQPETIRIVSIDIGKKNFSQYVQDISMESIRALQERYNALPKKKQRRVKGAMNPEIEEILKDLYLAGKQVFIGVYDFRADKESDKLDIPTRLNLLTHLNKYRWLWDTCDFFVIEQQFFRAFNPRRKKGKGGRDAGTQANVDAIKIGEATLMWFLDKYPLREAMYFGSQFKYQILGAPWGMDKSQRKKWAIVKTREICEMRGDFEMIELFKLEDRVFNKRLKENEEKIQAFIDSYPGVKEDTRALAEKVVRPRQQGDKWERQKLDDVSDTCIQVQAFIFKYLVAEF